MEGANMKGKHWWSDEQEEKWLKSLKPVKNFRTDLALKVCEFCEYHDEIDEKCIRPRGPVFDKQNENSNKPIALFSCCDLFKRDTTYDEE